MGFKFDCGFLAYGLCKDVSEMGGSIDASTTRRMEGVPFTYDQKLRASDERTDIPTTGPKVLLQRTYMAPAPSHHQLNSFAYRNGNGGVTLALSSEHSGKDVALCLFIVSFNIFATYQPHVLQIFSRFSMGFRPEESVRLWMLGYFFYLGLLHSDLNRLSRQRHQSSMIMVERSGTI
jgi:hypothetical protein